MASLWFLETIREKPGDLQTEPWESYSGVRGSSQGLLALVSAGGAVVYIFLLQVRPLTDTCLLICLFSEFIK